MWGLQGGTNHAPDFELTELVGCEVDPVAAVVGDGQVGELDVFQPVVAIIGFEIYARGGRGAVRVGKGRILDAEPNDTNHTHALAIVVVADHVLDEHVLAVALHVVCGKTSARSSSRGGSPGRQQAGLLSMLPGSTQN